jgi:hypothetical protein
MTVIHQGILYSGVGQVSRQLRFPHPLGEPEPSGVDSKPFPELLPHPADLLDAVPSRQ